MPRCYYGCLGAAKGACDNKMLVRRKLAETIILKAVREQLGRAERIRYLLEQVEDEVRKLHAHFPETVRTKEAELGVEERRLASFVDFIGEGRGSQALAKALVETERRVENLREELDGLRRSRERVFQAPPVEWIEERLAGMQEVPERRTDRSALLLRSLLGQVRLAPTRGQIGRPYYFARTSLALLSSHGVGVEAALAATLLLRGFTLGISGRGRGAREATGREEEEDDEPPTRGRSLPGAAPVIAEPALTAWPAGHFFGSITS